MRVPCLLFLLTTIYCGAELTWPSGQALPWFETPAATLDAISLRDHRADDLLTLSALQGQVNRTRPRIFLIDRRAEEGTHTWPESRTIQLGERLLRTKEELLEKYAHEISGVVLYDPTLSSHYRNLAGTIAGVEKALPMTPLLHNQLKSKGINLKVLRDLTKYPYRTSLEIYQYLYDHEWPRCSKRVILSARPSTRGGDHHHTRDLAAATGAAIIWLDGREPQERALMERFFKDMTAGEAIALGWYATERSGITTASKFGIGTLPADHFSNGSVYAGGDHRIRVAQVPPCPPLQNKIYVALMISDGDNIQYTQHAMRRIWDESEQDRGKYALNWTIAPGLVDIAPGILNHYYTTATPQDCFVTGPSGMGYAMPVNTLEEPGAPVGPVLTDPQRMQGYAEMTSRYLQRSGLRVMTIWDNATPMQRRAYETHCRSLYGATVQNFRDLPSVRSSIENKRLRFEKLVIPYTTTFEHLYRSLSREIQNKDPDQPLFLAYQVNIWKELKPKRLNQLASSIAQLYPDQVEFVRADHYFNLFNQANDLPYNLCLRALALQKGGDTLIDGSPDTSWQSEQPMVIDLKKEASILRIRLLVEKQISENLVLSVSSDAQKWHTINWEKRRSESFLDVDLPPTKARYLKVMSPDQSVSEIEVYGL